MFGALLLMETHQKRDYLFQHRLTTGTNSRVGSDFGYAKFFGADRDRGTVLCAGRPYESYDMIDDFYKIPNSV